MKKDIKGLMQTRKLPRVQQAIKADASKIKALVSEISNNMQNIQKDFAQEDEFVENYV